MALLRAFKTLWVKRCRFKPVTDTYTKNGKKLKKKKIKKQGNFFSYTSVLTGVL